MFANFWGPDSDGHPENRRISGVGLISQRESPHSMRVFIKKVKHKMKNLYKKLTI